MIRALKKRFIRTAMIAVTVLLILIFGALNLVNAWSAGSETKLVLEMLTDMETNGRRPDRPDGQNGPPEWELSEPPENDLQEGERKGFLSKPLTEDDWRAAVYFTVRTLDGAVVETDVSRISSVSAETAVSYGEKALAAGEQTGTIGDFRYASATAKTGETVWVFLENSSRTAAVLRVAALSGLAALVGWGLMLLLVIFLTKKAIAPIAENMDRQRQFITDAGHELKTPIAIIRANTEAMEMISGQNKWSRNISAQVTRLSELTRNLLTLARAEEVPQAGSLSELDFSALTQQTAQTFQEPMALRGITLDAEIEPDLRLRGSRDQLSTLLSILFDNAVKYAAEGSAVTLRLTRADKMLRLRMENDCESLPDCPPERLFDRFYRADSARTQKSGGFGIGLSAV
ncbi:MAG: sensor histidine kinase, partial [Oscillospiraceae bacterium]|nr:sensor histidine kinase [Oscillospiraceae bacterium]